MLFRQEGGDHTQVGNVELFGELYTADIRVDAILSYPWLRQNRLGVFPHMAALAMEDPFVLLKGFQHKGKSRAPSRRTVQRVTLEEVPTIPEPSSPTVTPIAWTQQPENWKIPESEENEPAEFLTQQEAQELHNLLTQSESE